MNRNRSLWILQAVLAALFVLAGGVKLLTPDAALATMIPLPTLFVRFIGTCELLGAAGLILPGLLGIRRELTALAAAGLVIIMTGAAILSPSLTGGDLTSSTLPFVLGILAACVVWGRSTASRGSARQPTAARASA